MYKGASRNVLLRSCDEWGECDDELGRIERITGNEIRATRVGGGKLEFVEQTEQQILDLIEEGCQYCGEIARHLKARGVSTAIGARWTDRIVKVFVGRYLPGKLRF
jgi:hypothetical protein